MKINANTKVAEILKASPKAIDMLTALSPKFSKLKNPILRRVMAPRVTLAQAASIGGCTVQAFFEALSPLGFEVECTGKEEAPVADEAAGAPFLVNHPNIKQVDVRPVLESGADPLVMILQEVRKMRKGQVICIINSFEPVPLIQLLQKKGFDSYVEHIGPSEVHTYFTSSSGKEFSHEDKVVLDIDAEVLQEFLDVYKGQTVEIDVRDLEMPLPMITILEELETLPFDHLLYVHHKKVPVYLLPELESRAWEYFIHRAGENDVKLLIKRKL